MKKQNLILTILAVVAIVAVGIAVWKIYKPSKVQSTNNEDIATSTATTTKEFEEKTISDTNSFYDLGAKYPSDPLDINNEIENFVNYKIKQKQDEWKIGGEIYNAEQEVAKQFPSREKMTYTYDISYEKYESKDKGTVSYIFNTYEFTGGAHGVSVVNTFTFNKDGKVEIDEILNLANNNNDIKLSKVLAENILAKGDDITTKDMLMEGLGLSYLKSDGITLDKAKCACDGFFFGSNFQNFYITNAGITFIFGQYEVAPGAAGNVSVLLDWNTLKPYLINPNF